MLITRKSFSSAQAKWAKKNLGVPREKAILYALRLTCSYLNELTTRPALWVGVAKRLYTPVRRDILERIPLTRVSLGDEALGSACPLERRTTRGLLPVHTDTFEMPYSLHPGQKKLRRIERMMSIDHPAEVSSTK
jgi:hypothetical protein